MKEIKFRAWDKMKNIMSDVIMLGGEENWKDGVMTKDYIGSWDRFEIQQYTGLKDKNGKEIYEGDIYHQGDKNILYKVIFKDCYFIGNQIGNESLAGLSHFIKDIEVIGNIFENPDLIK